MKSNGNRAFYGNEIQLSFGNKGFEEEEKLSF
jgi:hypothetical protein